MRRLNLPLVTLSEAEVEAAYAELTDAPTERPDTWDGMTDAEIMALVDDDRR